MEILGDLESLPNLSNGGNTHLGISYLELGFSKKWTPGGAKIGDGLEYINLLGGSIWKGRDNRLFTNKNPVPHRQSCFLIIPRVRCNLLTLLQLQFWNKFRKSDPLIGIRELVLGWNPN